MVNSTWSLPTRRHMQAAPRETEPLPVFCDERWAVDIEVMAQDANKGNFAGTGGAMGTSGGQVLAMGDSENDVAMPQTAGVGAAMGNAGEQARRQPT